MVHFQKNEKFPCETGTVYSSVRNFDDGSTLPVVSFRFCSNSIFRVRPLPIGQLTPSFHHIFLQSIVIALLIAPPTDALVLIVQCFFFILPYLEKQY